VALGLRQAFAHDGFDVSRDNQWQPAFHQRRRHGRRGDRLPVQTELEETILAGHAPGVMAITDTSPSYLLVPDPENPPPLRFLSRSTPAIPKPIESRTNPDGSGASSVTGVLKVSAKLGSFSSLALIPMQY
jgi:hypothetical protein